MTPSLRRAEEAVKAIREVVAELRKFPRVPTPEQADAVMAGYGKIEMLSAHALFPSQVSKGCDCPVCALRASQEGCRHAEIDPCPSFNYKCGKERGHLGDCNWPAPTPPAEEAKPCEKCGGIGVAENSGDDPDYIPCPSCAPSTEKGGGK